MFLDEIRHQLSDEVYGLLLGVGVSSYEELYAMMVDFPGMAKIPGLNFPSLSHVVVAAMGQQRAQTVRSALRRKSATAAHRSMGAMAPPYSQVDKGFGLGTQSRAARAGAISGLPATSIVVSLPTAVRDQGPRGTCVAQAVVAALEHRLHHSDLSEQFLYWAAKKRGGDPHPDDAGTWIECAVRALEKVGVCEESLWPYSGVIRPGNETHEGAGRPSAQALQDAQSRQGGAACYLNQSQANSGGALALVKELKQGPVAIALPVFFDALSRRSNWDWFGATEYGRVLDPMPTSVVDGGHAVCVSEYHPSGEAPGGGWFVFKNSWGLGWSASGSPPPGHPVWKPGYGYVSAAYVDEFLWELALL